MCDRESQISNLKSEIRSVPYEHEHLRRLVEPPVPRWRLEESIAVNDLLETRGYSILDPAGRVILVGTVSRAWQDPKVGIGGLYTGGAAKRYPVSVVRIVRERCADLARELRVDRVYTTTSFRWVRFMRAVGFEIDRPANDPCFGQDVIMRRDFHA